MLRASEAKLFADEFNKNEDMPMIEIMDTIKYMSKDGYYATIYFFKRKESLEKMKSYQEILKNLGYDVILDNFERSLEIRW